MKHKFNWWLTAGGLLVMITSAACQPITAAPSTSTTANTSTGTTTTDSTTTDSTTTDSTITATTVYGDSGDMGEGTVRTYAELNADGSPTSIGIVYTQGTLEGLPAEKNLEARCFDVNENGENEMDECIGDYELILSMPSEVTQNAGIPFQWATLNWNPHGHPPMVWSVPHFDFHFYTAPLEDVQAMRTGTCGALIDCEDFERATKPVPAQYVPTSYVSVGDAVARMGDHLIDSAAPEMADPPQAEFTHSFIYGAYDGHIAFFEPMITRDYLLNQPDECVSFSLPEAWETGGYYPTEYCIHYQADSQETTVSLENFVYREAS